jgi:thiamine biosynthesis lipoprotein
MSGLPGLRRVEQIMGMPIVVDVRDDVTDAILDEVFDWFREVDERFSTYKDTSEISRLNRDELALRDCHPDVRAVLARCDELREATGGFFDARYASLLEVDPSGLVKGWSVDRAGELFEARGIRNYSINAAGDIRTRGAALPEPVWRTGIQHPEAVDRIAAVVEGNDLAIATSGAYVRGQHILDPRTGRAPGELLSVTITGQDLGTADALATAVFAMGEEGPAFVTAIQPFEAYLMLADGTSLATSGFPFGEIEPE